MKFFKEADDFYAEHSEWNKILNELRRILLSTGLEECIKWGVPAYTLKGKIIIGVGQFKSYAGLWFHQGVFLKDEAKRLVNAQEGVTKALRQWRFESDEKLDTELVRAYVLEAIQNHLDGKELKPKKKDLVIPEELKKALKADKVLNDSFEELSLSCKREYADYVSEAKRDETKQRRLEKIIPMILEKVGLHDKYKD